MVWAAGSYTKGNAGTGGWAGDSALGIGIEAGRHDAQDNDFATGINQCINKDGSNSFTGNPNLGGFRPTNIAAGTAAAPALCVGNDVNTGVFGPAADTWAVATNASERLRVDSTGNVGIGVTNPSLKLDVQLSTNTADGLRVLNGNAGSAAASVVYLGNDQSVTASRIVVNSNANTGSYAGANSFNFYQGLNAPMSFWTAAAERMRIDSAGGVSFEDYVGIPRAITSSNYRLRVRGADTSSTKFAFQAIDSSNNDLLTVRNDGRVTIGIVASPSYSLQLAADSAAKPTTNTWTIASDERIKTNVQPYAKGLAEICQVNPITYDYNGKGGMAAGPGGVSILAQELQPVFPECVGSYKAKLEETDEEETDILNYNGHAITFALINAVKELNAKVEALEARVAELEA